MAGDAGRDLSSQEVRELLDEVGARLAAQGVRGQLFLYGGGAMALVHDARRVTRDVDALYSPGEIIDAVADRLADERGIERGWLNGNSNPWARHAREADTPRALYESPGLVVAVATVGQLIAMKLAAYRVKDKRDLAILFRDAGINDPAEGADIAEAIYGEDSIELPSRGDLLLQCREIMDMTIPANALPLLPSRLDALPGRACGVPVKVTGGLCRLTPGHGGRHRSILSGRRN